MCWDKVYNNHFEKKIVVEKLAGTWVTMEEINISILLLLLLILCSKGTVNKFLSFRIYDANNDGFIDFQEFMVIFS